MLLGDIFTISKSLPCVFRRQTLRGPLVPQQAAAIQPALDLSWAPLPDADGRLRHRRLRCLQSLPRWTAIDCHHDGRHL
eukprot:scaffold165771_cov36-Prasinocladus_malaysianus.AAC.1